MTQEQLEALMHMLDAIRLAIMYPENSDSARLEADKAWRIVAKLKERAQGGGDDSDT